MPTITDAPPDVGQLNADIQVTAVKLDELTNQLLAKCAAYSKSFQDDCAQFETDLDRGVEARRFAGSLAHSRDYGLALLRALIRLRETFAGWGKTIQVLAPLIKQVEASIARLDELLARINRPTPPIDEAVLRERSRVCDEKNAWIPIDDAAAELRKGSG